MDTDSMGLTNLFKKNNMAMQKSTAVGPRVKRTVDEKLKIPDIATFCYDNTIVEGNQFIQNIKISFQQERVSYFPLDELKCTKNIH